MQPIRTTIILLLLLTSQLGFSQITGKLQSAVYFETAKFDISDSFKIALKSLSDTIKLKKKLQISISGNTDNVGDSIFNLLLSENRSKAVKKYLVENGIDSNKIKFGYNGENKPLADNESETGKQKNRRVDIAIKWEIPPPPEPKGDVKQLISLLANPISSHCININRDTILFTERGTKLLIFSNAFGDQNVCKEECITIEFKDAIGQADMIFDNLTTVSNGELLESTGMAFLNAKCGKKPLRIKKQNSVFIAFPLDTLKDDVKVFYGQRTNETTPMNWNLSKKDKIFNVTNDVLSFDPTNPNDLHKDIKSNLLAEAMKNRKKGCLGIGGMSGKKVEEQIDNRLESIEEQFKQNPNENFAGLSNTMVWTIASVSKMGWINCDRFTKMKTISYKVNTPANATTSAYIALKRYNSMMTGTPNNKVFYFTVPSGLNYKALVLRYEDSKPSLGTLEGNTQDPSGTITFKTFDSVTDLKNAIKAYLSK